MLAEMDFDLLADLAISGAEIEVGIDPARVGLFSGLNLATLSVSTRQQATKMPMWSAGELAFLHANHDRMTLGEISQAIGRNENAVKIKRVREHLPALSTAKTEYLTALTVANMLGIDGHKTAHWVDIGFLPGREQPGERRIRLIRRVSFMVWALTPANWIYFDPAKVTDPHLRRLLALRAARWGDEWWSTKQVAEYHGVDVGDVKRYIEMGIISATRMTHSLGGRNLKGTWAYWFVRKSEATRPDLVFYTLANPRPMISPRAAAWILRARDELGLPYDVIGRMMGRSWKRARQNAPGMTGTTIAKYYQRLKSAQA